MRTQLPAPLGLFSANPGLISATPRCAKGTGRQLVLYHQGCLAGAFSFVVLLPETASCVLVLVNTKPLSDAADWIGQAFLEALLDSPERNDYLALAAEAVKGQALCYQSARDALERAREHGTLQRPLEQYCGRYYWSSERYFIDIVSHSNGIALVIQGRDDLVYRLKHHHYDTFTWLMTDEEEFRRARFVQVPEAYKMVFKRNEVDRVESFVWQEMGGGPGVFQKSVDDVAGGEP